MILNLISSHEKLSPLFAAALCFFSFQFAPAQRVPAPTPKTTTVPGIKIITPRPLPTPPKESKTVVMNEGDTPAEKSIATESKVNITLCVTEGKVRINGWDRDEIRAYVENGSEVGFKIVQKSAKTEKPVWVYVLGFDPQKKKEIKPEECLSGSNIELDVPRNSTVALKSQESETRIESVGKVSVETLDGDIFLNDIAYGVRATTYRGDITVENSSGQMVLTNTDGNILAVGANPSDIGDIFKAKTNSGRITLSGVEHRQIDTSTISGSTGFDGELLSGGQYGFSTTSGSIVLGVSPDSLCKISAWFGFGAFASDFPLQNVLKKEQSLSAQMGSGEATCSLNLKTGSGVIRLRSNKTDKKEAEKKTKTISDKKSVSKKKIKFE